jgi:uncharacterized membrane protein YadS
VSFLLISILVSFFPLSTNVLSVTELLGKIILTIAMAAIGLKVNFLQLIKAGRRGMVFALLVFLLQISLLWMVK